MIGGIIVIVVGLVIAIGGPTIGVTVSRGEGGSRKHAKVYGGAAAGIGVLIIIYGIYLVATAP